MANGLVFAGALILISALLLVKALIAQLPQGHIRRNWFWMTLMVILFFLSYLGYMYAFAGSHRTALDLMVPGVFFLGACFVWLTSNLSLRTLMIVIRISSLEREVLTDPLTGAFNRRHMDHRLAEEVSGALRYHLPLSVLMIDIDRFKSINDTPLDIRQATLPWWHSPGLRVKHWTTDVFTRYGGEEFLVIAPHTTEEGAIQLAERLRQRIANSPLQLSGEQNKVEVNVTVSIGVASLTESVLDTESLMRLADGNLYRAKQEGRNRVVAGNASPQNQ